LETKIVRYASVDVVYSDDLVGGGEKYGQDYLRLVGERLGRVERVFEWCCGPGFIGFSLLAHGLCQSLCLADINPIAVAAARETVRRNRLDDVVSVYLSDGLLEIPATERWNLVVGNPPHSGTDRDLGWGDDAIYKDPGWTIHRGFYSRVARFLAPGAEVVVQENCDLSSLESFVGMIESGGLEVVGTEHCRTDDHIYYLRSRRRASE
jgi:methylase of polypeptide subunit release factors